MTRICSKCGKEKSEWNSKNVCMDCRKEYLKEWYETNKDKLNEYSKEYYKTNKEYKKEYKKEYYKTNKDKIKENSKEWYEKNKDKLKEKIKNDPILSFKHKIRIFINQSIKRGGYKKNSRSEKVLGCTFAFLKKYLKQTAINNGYLDFDIKEFINNNNGKYHIDHIKPLSLARSEQEIIHLNHYTNLQILLAQDNLSKSNKITLDN